MSNNSNAWHNFIKKRSKIFSGRFTAYGRKEATMDLANLLTGQCRVADREAFNEVFQNVHLKKYPIQTYASKAEMLAAETQEDFWPDLIELCAEFMENRVGDSRWEELSELLKSYKVYLLEVQNEH